MRVHVLYFAFVRERLGRERDEVEISDLRGQIDRPAIACAVADVLAQLCAREPGLVSMLAACRVARNGEFVDVSAPVADGDELAIIPPVAGGSGGGGDASPLAPYVALLDAPLSVDRCLAAVERHEAGATVVFIGHVRELNRGVRVVRLDYSAYATMALAVMHRLCREIVAEIPGSSLAVEHRIGSLAIGDYAVIIAAASPHRAEAFAACRALIERLKQDVPIWKKEFGEDGAHWIGMGP